MTTGRTQKIQAANPNSVGLPPRPFFYTLDQISVILNLEEPVIRRDYVHYEGRSVGFAGRDRMVARNIAPADKQPDWRIAEQELIRWMKRKGFRYYERGYVGF